ncbi:MAG: hypothetical protein ACXWQO_00500 [Bdellovibrionota bacterium]
MNFVKNLNPRKNLGIISTWLAVGSLVFIPQQQAMALSNMNAQVAAAAAKANNWGTVGNAIEVLKKAHQASQAAAFTDLVKKLKVDMNTVLPKFHVTGNFVMVDGYPRKIQILSVSPMKIGVGNETLLISKIKSKDLDATYKSLNSFLEKNHNGKIQALLNFLVPEANAGSIEIGIGILLFLWGVSALSGGGNHSNSDNEPLTRSEKAYLAEMKRLTKENGPLISQIVCAGTPSASVTSVYIGSKTSRDLGLEKISPDHLAYTLVKKLEDGSDETTTYTFLKNKEGKWDVSAKSQKGMPYHVSIDVKAKGWWDTDHNSWILVHDVKADGSPLWTNETEKTRILQGGTRLNEESLKKWSDDDGQVIELPVKSFDPATMRTIFHSSDSIPRACAAKGQPQPEPKDDDEGENQKDAG